MAIINNNIYKYILALLLVFVLSFALIQSSLAAEKPAKDCRVRSNVSADETRELMGLSVAFKSGSRLSLEASGFGFTPGDAAIICTYSLIKFATQVVFIVILAFAVLLIAYAALLFLTAGNNPTKQGKARNLLLFSVVGLVLATLAKVVPVIVRSLIGI